MSNGWFRDVFYELVWKLMHTVNLCPAEGKIEIARNYKMLLKDLGSYYMSQYTRIAVINKAFKFDHCLSPLEVQELSKKIICV